MAIAWEVARVSGATRIRGVVYHIPTRTDPRAKALEEKGLLALLRQSEIELGKELKKVKRMLRAQKLKKSKR